MLTLITGAPGAGKTNYLIEKIRKYEGEGRPLFQHGIPNLKLANTKIFCRNEDCEVCIDPPKGALFVDEWADWAQTHYVIIVDEVQQVWRPRGNRDHDIPEGLRKLETHRHKGIDFWFMTQHPSFLDVHARRLISSHIHIKNTWHGRMLYENPEAQMDPTKLYGGKLHKLDKSAFKEYQSADVHTKTKFKKPKALIFFLFAIGVFIPGTGYLVYSRFISPDSRYRQAVTGLEAVSERAVNDYNYPPGISAPAASQFQSAIVESPQAQPLQLDFTPRDIRFPQTAPAYDSLNAVLVAPRVSACIHKPPTPTRAEYCQCYTQQATKLLMPIEICKEYTQQLVFDPWKLPSEPLETKPTVAQDIDAETISEGPTDGLD